MSDDKPPFPRPRQGRLLEAGRTMTVKSKVIGRGVEGLAELHRHSEAAVAAASARAGTLRHWSSKIRRAWQQVVEDIIETGQILLEARQALKHEPEIWDQLVGTHEKKGAAPFALSTASRLMSIAQDERLVSHMKRLPARWGTLYELSRLSDEAFELGIESGRIHPDMERKDVQGLAKEVRYRETVRGLGSNEPAPAEPAEQPKPQPAAPVDTKYENFSHLQPPAQASSDQNEPPQSPELVEPPLPRPLPVAHDPETDRVFAELLRIRRAEGWLAPGCPYLAEVFDVIDRWQVSRANPPRAAEETAS
jgi:hypothetical protein